MFSSIKTYYMQVCYKLNDSKLFWWILGATNATSAALHLAAEQWVHATLTLALMGWAMYELNRIEKQSKENDNGGS
jgi:hypothetical protein